MTLQEAKDRVAQKYGYNAWELGENAMLTHVSNESTICKRLEHAAELYAEAKAREAFDAARESLPKYSKGLCLYPDYETYKKHNP